MKPWPVSAPIRPTTSTGSATTSSISARHPRRCPSCSQPAPSRQVSARRRHQRSLYEVLARIVAMAQPHPGRPRARANASCRRSSGTLGESRGGVSPPRAPRTVRDTLASYGSRCSAIPMRDGKRLCLGHRAPPATGWLWVAAEHCSPFGPVPLQNLPPSYELLRPCAPPRYSDPCGLSRLDVSLCIGATGSHVPYKSLIRLRAASMPDVARAVFRTAPELIPEARRPSGFDIIFGISTRHQQFAFARLSGSYLTGLSPAFDCNAHHDRS